MPLQPIIRAAIEAGEIPKHRLKLATVINLRWFLTAGELIGTLLVYVIVDQGLYLWSCLTLIFLAATFNLVLQFWVRPGQRLSTPFAVAMLAFDILQLGLFLFCTGGLDNPFAFLVLAPVLVSASTLPSNATMTLGALAGVVATLLVIVHLPLPWTEGNQPVLPPLYLIAVWIAFLTTLGFSAVFAFRVNEEARQLSDALTAVELVLAREHHLSALDGLAAAAAHELGTPLGTIAVVARELEREAPPGSSLAQDIALIKAQSDRCREILRRLSMMASEGDRYLDRQPLLALVEEAIAPFRENGPELRVHAIGSEPQPIAMRNPGVMHGLTNIVENAADFAVGAVDIFVMWTSDIVRIEICDDGPGFPPDILARLGEPFLSTRPTRLASVPPAERAVAGGMGLGFFIARTLLMRSGAAVSCRNRTTQQTGAIVTVEWPRDAFDIVEES